MIFSTIYKYNKLHSLSLYIYIYIYIYIITVLVVTISLGGFVADQMRYNLESARYM